jgi:hypothetical protein
MSEPVNPYQPPTTPLPPPAAAPTWDRIRLRQLANRQRAVMFLILGQIGLLIVYGVAPPGLKPIASLLLIAIGLATLVSVVLFALSLGSTLLAILMGLVAIVPCLSLLCLLIVNQRANAIFERHGVKVGFLGADPGQFT